MLPVALLPADRPNLEMMMHLEGPIVQSLYDTALISFANPLVPTLPLLTVPPSPDALAGFGFQDSNPWLAAIPVASAAEATRRMLEGHGFAGHPNPDSRKPALKDLVRAIIEKGAETPAAPPRRMSLFEDLGEGLGGRLEGFMGEGKRSNPGSRSNSRGPSRRASTDGESAVTRNDPSDLEADRRPLLYFQSSVAIMRLPANRIPSSARPAAQTLSNRLPSPPSTPPLSPPRPSNRAYRPSPRPIRSRRLSTLRQNLLRSVRERSRPHRNRSRTRRPRRWWANRRSSATRTHPARADSLVRWTSRTSRSLRGRSRKRCSLGSPR